MKEVVDNFNRAIENQIWFNLRQQPLRRRDPSESTVFLPGTYTPSKRFYD
jgi:hypothetical protein